jgi:Ribbon-helix-helix protein, copG family
MQVRPIARRGCPAFPYFIGHIIYVGMQKAATILGQTSVLLPAPENFHSPGRAAWQFRSTILWWRVLRPAMRHGIPGEDIRHAIGNAVAVEEVGDDPRALAGARPRPGREPPGTGGDGPPRRGRRSFTPCRCGPHTGGCSEGQARTGMNHGHRKDGTPITDADVEAMADEAEQGYDVDTLLRRRRGGRPPLGSAAASVESVRLDPELKRALLVRAAQEHVSVSEVIRRAIGEYLRAS